MWFVEGLEDGRVAVITKVHHCMIDGVSGVDLLAGFLVASERARLRAGAARWLPRPAPSQAKLLADEIALPRSASRPALPAPACAPSARRSRAFARRATPSRRWAQVLAAGFDCGLEHAAERRRRSRTGASTGRAWTSPP